MVENNNLNEQNEEDDMIVTLELDDGTEIECAILTIFDVKDTDYIALIPLNEDGEGNEDGEVLIYRYAEDGEGNPSLSNIEDDEEYEIVAERFDEILDEDEFGDDEDEEEN
ncbi:MAG: DUF1292 domain-containing protein [Lachnospiraceae bacterium]|jgi:uncharacterized protein YrzB (UPF0473 family)|nr:DUF1292 domain-containing protein [Lachnospiraceae bacterium]